MAQGVLKEQGVDDCNNMVHPFLATHGLQYSLAMNVLERRSGFSESSPGCVCASVAGHEAPCPYQV